MRVGFVGLGLMGTPMARAIARAGFQLTVWARRPEAVAGFSDAQVAASLTDLASRSDLLCICVRDDAGVEEVVASARDSLPPDAAVVVHSTVHPDTVRRIAESGLRVLDATVSGGPAAADRGALVVFAGGERDLYEACLPVLSSYGDPVRLLGDVGAGQMAKLLNNLLFATNLGAVRRVLALATYHQLDSETLSELFERSSAASFALSTSRRAPESFDVAQALLEKDLALLRTIVPGPLLDAAITNLQ